MQNPSTKTSMRHESLITQTDVFNVSRFSPEQVDEELSRLTGVDKLLYEFLQEQNRLTPQLIRQVVMEMISEGLSFSRVMLSKGIVMTAELNEVSLRVSPDELSKKQEIDSNIPFAILNDLKVMLSAISPDKIFLSSLKHPDTVKMALRPFYPDHEFYFTPSRPKLIREYLEKAERYSRKDAHLMDVLLKMAVKSKASDVHIQPIGDKFTISFRVLGNMVPVFSGNYSDYATLVSRIKTQSKLDVANRLVPQDGKFALDFNNQIIDVRVSTLPVVGGESSVLRILNPENSQVQFSDLGITKHAELVKAMKSQSGIIIICGITGSGKSTTIASALRWVYDRFSQSISSLEHPVENFIGHIKQTQVSAHVTYADGLRAILRQDPDVVFVGELRDPETASIAFAAADTGHVVVTTLHVGSIKEVPSRLRSLGIDDAMIMTHLRGACVQKLFKATCRSCRGTGCHRCNYSGYDRRTLATEVKYFRQRRDVSEIFDMDAEQEWDSVLDDAYRQYRDGITDRNEMVATWGSDFEEYELDCASRDAALASKGLLSSDEFSELYPTITLDVALSHSRKWMESSDD